MDTVCNTEQIGSDEFPIYNKPTLPEDGQLILLSPEKDYDCGGDFTAAFRLPLSRLTPGSSFQSNTYSLSAPTSGITVSENQVVPAYVETFSPHQLKRAQANSSTTLAKFLIVGKDQNIDGSYIIQNSGYYSFPTVHGLSIGQTYYLSETDPGGITTQAPTLAQPLFYVVDAQTIQLGIGD